MINTVRYRERDEYIRGYIIDQNGLTAHLMIYYHLYLEMSASLVFESYHLSRTECYHEVILPFRVD